MAVVWIAQALQYTQEWQTGGLHGSTLYAGMAVVWIAGLHSIRRNGSCMDFTAPQYTQEWQTDGLHGFTVYARAALVLME
jgi:hypothetical protein